MLKRIRKWVLISKIRRMLASRIRKRSRLSDAEAVEALATEAAVSSKFATRFLDSLATHYGLPMGQIQPDDRFSHELSIRRDDPEWDDRFSGLLNADSMSTDGDLFSEFLEWVWYSESLAGKGDLFLLAEHPEMTVKGLCETLYNLELR